MVHKALPLRPLTLICAVATLRPLSATDDGWALHGLKDPHAQSSRPIPTGPAGPLARVYVSARSGRTDLHICLLLLALNIPKQPAQSAGGRPHVVRIVPKLGDSS